MSNATDLSSIALDAATLSDLTAACDNGWIYITSVLIFFMQAGFALLEAGAVGSKDIISILLKNFADFGISTICYWIVGFGLHNGPQPFIGASQDTAFYATADVIYFPKLISAAMFCATAITIVSGAVACRFSFHAYMLLCVVFSSFIYPITASWIWGTGFLSPDKLGAIDFAGSGVVHLQGATIAMTACLFVGPRIGRFVTDPATGKLTPSSDFNGNSIVLTALGTLILWFGWYGFNPGSTGGLSNGRHLVAGVAALNTTLAGSSALLTGLFLTRIMEKSYNFWDVLNSILAGLVAITAACATVGPGPSIGIGVLAAFTYHFTNKLVLSLGIDDVVGAFSVHGTPGAVGLICTGLFSRQDYIDRAFGAGVIHYDPGRQLGVQLLFIICVFAWAVFSSALVLYGLTKTIGIRVSEDDEIVGLDFKYHSGYAYETHNKRMLRAKKQIEREQILGQKMRKAVNRQNTLFREASNHSVNENSAQQASQQTNPHTQGNGVDPAAISSLLPSMHNSRDAAAMIAIHEHDDSAYDSDPDSEFNSRTGGQPNVVQSYAGSNSRQPRSSHLRAKSVSPADVPRRMGSTSPAPPHSNRPLMAQTSHDVLPGELATGVEQRRSVEFATSTATSGNASTAQHLTFAKPNRLAHSSSPPSINSAGPSAAPGVELPSTTRAQSIEMSINTPSAPTFHHEASAEEFVDANNASTSNSQANSPSHATIIIHPPTTVPASVAPPPAAASIFPNQQFQFRFNINNVVGNSTSQQQPHVPLSVSSSSNSSLLMQPSSLLLGQPSPITEETAEEAGATPSNI